MPTNQKSDHVHAIVRVDMAESSQAGWENRITVVQIVDSEGLARQEVEKLRRLDEEKKYVLFWQSTEYHHGSNPADGTGQEVEATRKQALSDFIQDLIDQGNKADDPWDFPAWFSKVDAAIRPLFQEQDLEQFFMLAKGKRNSLQERDNCVAWLKAVRLKYCVL